MNAFNRLNEIRDQEISDSFANQKLSSSWGNVRTAVSLAAKLKRRTPTMPTDYQAAPARARLISSTNRLG